MSKKFDRFYSLRRNILDNSSKIPSLEALNVFVSFVVQELENCDFICFSRVDEKDNFFFSKNYRVVNHSDIFSYFKNKDFTEKEIYTEDKEILDWRNFHLIDKTIKNYPYINYCSNRFSKSYLYPYYFAADHNIHTILELFFYRQLSESELIFLKSVFSFLAYYGQMRYSQIKNDEFNKRIKKIENFLPKGTIDYISKYGELKEEKVIVPTRNRFLISLFLDIRGFTNYLSQEKPDKVFQYLTHFFSFIVKTLNDYDGYVNKILGDGILCFWGLETENIDKNIENTILSIIKIFKKIEENQKSNQIPKSWKVGIGVSMGDCLIGNIGGEGFNDFSIIGNCINDSSHISGAAINEALIDDTIIPFLNRNNKLKNIDFQKTYKKVSTKNKKDVELISISL